MDCDSRDYLETWKYIVETLNLQIAPSHDENQSEREGTDSGETAVNELRNKEAGDFGRVSFSGASSACSTASSFKTVGSSDCCTAISRCSTGSMKEYDLSDWFEYNDI
mmetsp:Transcript_20650/g.41313  ORF Transcript_20650/g.41313 Transcript_20650/m.41313 type:complete len:108 (+) Transcript_20650:226-549(+)|eukprot:CAMPEP_0194334304 /NCGR_PEP_ID=MMETSP0171-20130528/65667_1 /TAXON_ID=218684 /ORGANISM="Corethron pennatum, Strain L29A3" /LENGTH=107 /DNA_ID=CAMNT_0039096893 /DNA_START=332 /DNA_END=658 /DNA_ORIENTATION=+